MAAPLRDRFGIQHRLEFYTEDEIAQIITRAANILDVKIDKPASKELAKRARLTPRIANRLLKRVRDFADINGDGVIDTKIAHGTMDLLEIDEVGLDPADRRILETIIEHHNGGPVGVDTLSAITGDERTTIEDFFEPYLMQIGMLERTPRGRKVTAKAYKHLDKKPKTTDDQIKLV